MSASAVRTLPYRLLAMPTPKCSHDTLEAAFAHGILRQRYRACCRRVVQVPCAAVYQAGSVLLLDGYFHLDAHLLPHSGRRQLAPPSSGRRSCGTKCSEKIHRLPILLPSSGIRSVHALLLALPVQLSTLMPWLLGTKRWTRHQEKLVFVARCLRTAALQAQINPKASCRLNTSKP